MNASLLIARKDLRQRLRDKSALIFGIIAPLALSVVFSLIFGPLDDPSESFADIVVVNEDGGTLADAFVGSLEAVEEEGVITLSEAETEEAARDIVEANSSTEADPGETADAAYVIPEGFSEAIETGGETELLVIGSGASDFGVQIADSIANGFAAEVGAVGLSVQTAIPHDAPPDPAMIAGLVPMAAQTVSPISVEDLSARTKQLDYSTYLSAGMAVFFLFFTVQFGVSGLLEERHLGTMTRLLAAPIRRRSLLIGKALTAFALGIISMTVLAVGTTVALGADWGNPVGVAILIVAATFSALGILAVVATFAKTPEQAGNFGAIISLVLGFLGGTFFQVSQVGGILGTLSLLTPHQWFLRGLAELHGGEILDILPAVGALLAFGLVTGGLAWPALKKAVQQ